VVAGLQGLLAPQTAALALQQMKAEVSKFVKKPELMEFSERVF